LGLRNRFEFWLAEDAKPARQASLSAAAAETKKPAADSKAESPASANAVPNETSAPSSAPAAAPAALQP